MILNKYDFYDIHMVLCLLRSDPSADYNADIIKSIVKVLGERQENNIVESNIVRKELRSVKEIDSESFSWIYVDNVYTYGSRFEKNDFYYEIMIKAFYLILSCLDEKEYDKVYDLADAFHNIPIFIADKGKNLKKFAKIQFYYYNKKYKTNLWKELLG